MAPTSRIAIATVSRDAAEAGARVADEGGNAVDAAIAAALVATVTHPAMCSLGGGGFLTIQPGSGSAVTVDGGHEMPGRGLPRERFGAGGVNVHLEYGGGVETTVGPGSVATPGILAACALAAERYGRLPWRELLQPAWERARDGFPMPASSHHYLTFSHRLIYSRDPRSRDALHDATGRLLDPGETIRVEGLADSLRAIADGGAEIFYRGEVGRRIAEHVEEEGGILTRRDLESYRAAVRRPLRASLDGWRLSTNPPPAVGGAVLAAMLRLMAERRPPRGGTAEEVRRLVAVQEAVLDYRRRRLDPSLDLDGDVRRLLRAAARGSEGVRRAATAASTLHTSAVDGTGMACAVTLSDGYGSGIVPPGTGIWLNNCLGELELNRRGFHTLPPGTRLPSNMAPTVGRGSEGAVLAVGSPGADRITTAILQVLLNFIRLGMPLEEAVAAPRLHVERGPTGPRVACEPGVPADALENPVRRFPERSMYFGGVAAALWRPGSGFELAGDPRRTGGTAVGGRS